jgi:hypothetical protein
MMRRQHDVMNIVSFVRVFELSKTTTDAPIRYVSSCYGLLKTSWGFLVKFDQKWLFGKTIALLQLNYFSHQGRMVPGTMP